MKIGHFSLQDKDFKYKGFIFGSKMKKEMQFMYIFLWMKKHWKKGENTHFVRFVDAEIDHTSRIQENSFN